MTTEPRAAIVAFISPKGGVGKSTSCVTLAAATAKKGYSVRIIDFDQTETLWRWYSANEQARAINNLTVEKGPTADIPAFIDTLWSPCGYDFIFVDLAGSLSRAALLLAAVADITITPAKLNEPDVVEAHKLTRELKDLAISIKKPLVHRLLINEMPFGIMPTHQAMTLDQIDSSDMVRFQNVLHLRPIYAETWLTGTPPHFADASRGPVQKAVDEIDLITEELLAIFQPQEERAAA